MYSVGLTTGSAFQAVFRLVHGGDSEGVGVGVCLGEDIALALPTGVCVGGAGLINVGCGTFLGGDGAGTRLMTSVFDEYGVAGGVTMLMFTFDSSSLETLNRMRIETAGTTMSRSMTNIPRPVSLK